MTWVNNIHLVFQTQNFNMMQQAGFFPLLKDFQVGKPFNLKFKSISYFSSHCYNTNHLQMNVITCTFDLIRKYLKTKHY